MEIFKIGSTDFSSNVVVPNYKVNRNPDYDSYEDCNYVTHKYIKRRKVSGELSLKFYSMDDFIDTGVVIHGYRTFINAYNSAQNVDGSIEATFYLNKELIQYTGLFDIEFDPNNSIPLYGIKDTEEIKVTITER